MKFPGLRRFAVTSSAVLLGVAGLGTFIAGSASPASAKTFHNVLCHTDLGVDQTMDITLSLTGPTQVDPGSRFTVTVPGGTATLPDSALDGAVTIVGFQNLSTSYSLTSTPAGGRFITGSLASGGQATINGNPVTQTGSLNSGTITIDTAPNAEIPPGTLVTPAWTANVLAPSGNAYVTFHANVLTTTADIQGLGPVVATCDIPPDPLLTVKVGTPPTTTTTTTTIAPPVTTAPGGGGAVTTVAAAAPLPFTGKSSTGPLAVVGLAAMATGAAFVFGSRRRRRSAVVR